MEGNFTSRNAMGYTSLGAAPSEALYVQTGTGKRDYRQRSQLFLCALWLTIIWRLPLMSQEPTPPEMTPGLSRSPHSFVGPAIAKAKVADTEKGALAYAADLTSFVVSDRPGKSYVKKFARRLASADLAARHGNQGWVSESAVAQAFNELMEQVAASPAQLIKTDVSVVHRLRFSLYNTSPDLSTVTSHEDKCLPSEAVFVIALLMWNNGAVSALSGSVPPPTSKGGYVAVRFSGGPDARLLLSRYLAASSHRQMVNLYDHLAQTIGF